MKRIRHFVLIGCLALWTASAYALPPQVEMDRLSLQARDALETRDYATAVEKMARMRSLGVKLPDSFYYQYGAALLELGRYKEAQEMLGKYLQDGRQVKFYSEALEKYNRAEAGASGARGKLQKVHINSRGGLMSTYDLDGQRSQIQLVPGLKYSLDDVIRLAHERSWPESISTFENRNREEISSSFPALHAYLAGRLPPDKVLLFIPRKENLRAGEITMDRDVFMLFKTESVDLP